MSEAETDNPTVQHIYIQIRGLSPESAKAIQQQFISWLSNSGEQEFWMCCEMRGDYEGENTTFDYNYVNGEYAPDIIIKEYESDENTHIDTSSDWIDDPKYGEDN